MLKPHYMETILNRYADEIMDKFRPEGIDCNKTILTTNHETFKDGLYIHNHVIQDEDDDNSKGFIEYPFDGKFNYCCVLCDYYRDYYFILNLTATDIFYETFPEIDQEENPYGRIEGQCKYIESN